MLCHGARGSECRQRLTGVESGPSPRLAGSARGGVDARTARAFITTDAVAFAETAEVEGVDMQAELEEMRPHFARAVCWARIPQDIQGGLQIRDGLFGRF